MRNELLLEYSFLTDGETIGRQLCPACRGGSTGEHSLSVSRRGDFLLWKCHRASCNFSGNAGSKGNGTMHYSGGGSKVPTTKGVVGRTYYRNSSSLPEEVKHALSSKYYFSPRQLNLFGWDSDAERVALPVPNVEGDLLGCVLRSEKGEQPKALSYTEEDAVAIFRNHSSDSLIIVEDIYSAIRASEYMNAAAILGTHLNQERVDTLRYLKCRHNYLALDADAFDKTIKYVKRFRNILQMVPVKLERDLKNHTSDELKEFFNDLT